jgi:type IV secretion system protein VirB7
MYRCVLRKIFLIGLVVSLSGCAAIQYPLPSCSGAARRPLNKSMWDWQKAGLPTGLSILGETPASDAGSSLASVANHVLGIAGSYRSCNG